MASIIMGSALNNIMLPHVDGLVCDGAQINITGFKLDLQAGEKELIFDYELLDLRSWNYKNEELLLSSAGQVELQLNDLEVEIHSFKLGIDEWSLLSGSLNFKKNSTSKHIKLDFENELDLSELRERFPEVIVGELASKSEKVAKVVVPRRSYGPKELYVEVNLQGLKVGEKDKISKIHFDLANRGETYLLNDFSYLQEKKAFSMNATVINSTAPAIKISEVNGPINLKLIDELLNLKDPKRKERLSGILELKNTEYNGVGNDLEELKLNHTGRVELVIRNLEMENLTELDDLYKKSMINTLGLNPDHVLYQKGEALVTIEPNHIDVKKLNLFGSSGEINLQGEVKPEQPDAKTLHSQLVLGGAFPGGSVLKTILKLDPKLLTRDRHVRDLLRYDTQTDMIYITQNLKMNGVAKDGLLSSLIDDTKHKSQREFDYLIQPLVNLTKAFDKDASATDTFKSILDFGLGELERQERKKKAKKSAKKKTDEQQNSAPEEKDPIKELLNIFK